MHVASWRAAYDGLLDAAYLSGLSVARRAQGWRDILSRGGTTVRLADRGGRIVGFVSHGACRDDGATADQGEVHALYADPAHWHTGVGRRLLDEAVADLRARGRARISLWVLADNARAIRFYRAAGFAMVDGSRKTFELGGRVVDEVAMRLDAPR